MSNNFYKFLWLILCGMVSTIVVCTICFCQAKIFDTDYLLNYTFIISAIASLAAVLVWNIKNKDSFENFLTFMIFLFFNMLLIYIGPLTVNRSLSTFIYLYAVQNGEIKKDIFDENYNSAFMSRRFYDGEKFGFLNCDNEVCKPNIRTKIFYYILYTTGKLTASDKHYKEFKEFVDNKNQ